MSVSPLWLVNTNGNVFTLSTRHERFRQLVKTYQDGVKLKRVAACQSGAWGIGHDQQVYIFIHHTEVPIRVQETTYENQRWTPISGFSGSNLLPTDRTNWSDESGNGFRPKENFCLPSTHWKWDGDWEIDDNFHGQISSRGGWQYATNFTGKWLPESKWNSCVRKRKWIRFRRFIATNLWAKLFDDKMNESGDCFIDISVGGFDIPSQPKGHICVWAISNNGQVYIRYGVSQDCPEGTEWRVVPTDSLGLINICVGPTGLVWGVTWDGKALVRLGVDREHVYGTAWAEVSYPDESTRIMQIALGLNSLWALSREGKVWYRKGIQGTQTIASSRAATGTTWIEMVGEMMQIAVTPTDQVFAIGLNDKEIYFRTGVTSNDLGGKTWQMLTLKENTSILQQDSLSSIMSDSLTESDFEESCRYSSSDSQMKSAMVIGPAAMTLAKPIRSVSDVIMPSACHMTPATLIKKTDPAEQVCSHNDSIPEKQQVTDKMGYNIEDPTTLFAPTESDLSLDHHMTTESGSENEQIVVKHVSNGHDGHTDCDIKTDNTQITHEQSNTKTDTCDIIIEEEEVFMALAYEDRQGPQVHIASTVEEDVSNITDEVTTSENIEGGLIPVSLSSHDTMDSLGSSINSEKDVIFNFVTDLLSASSTTEEKSKSEADEEDFKVNTAKRPDTLDTTNESQIEQRESPFSEVFETPSSETDIPWTTMVPSMAVSGTISVRSTPSFEQESVPWVEMTPAMPRYCWAWLSGMACMFEDSEKISWLQDRKDNDSTQGSKRHKAKISLVLRESILRKLQARNIKEMENFKFIDSAVERTSWLKKGNMQWYMYGRKPQWINCSVEVEQGHGEKEDGSLTFQYAYKGKQMHSQTCIQDIVCVKRLNDTSEKTAFVVHTPDTVKCLQPLLLKTSSENETEDWISLLCTVNAENWKLAQPVSIGSVWSTTMRGDILVHLPDETDIKGYQMCWIQHGGHLRVVEASTSGVVWGIGYDNSAWTYSGGYGGGMFKATSHLSKDVSLQMDVRTVSVCELQSWYPVVGYTSQGYMMTEDTGITDRMSKKYDSKEEVPLQSSKWQWVTDWKVDFELKGEVDNEGWQYSSNLQKPFHKRRGLRDGFRRRKWKRKCRLETVGPWEYCQSMGITDVSIQVVPVSSSCEPIIVWAVAANGNVMTRFGVTTENPQGDSWIHVPTDQPFQSVSVGGSCRVWAIAKEGSAWYRSGVTQYNISGTCWLQIVPTPPAGCFLKQISVGLTAVWAVDTRGNLWVREEITETFPEGTRWTLVSINVRSVSVGPQDEVWIVAGANFMKNRKGPGVLYRRIGISELCPAGNGWESIIGAGWEHVSVRGLVEMGNEAEELPLKQPL